MSFAAGFGLDVAINAIVLGVTLLPPSQNAKVRLGCGSKARDEAEGSLTGGGRPDIVLYDTYGDEIARKVGGEAFDPGSNPTIDMGFDLLDPGKATRSPEYLKLVARGEDAVHAGYGKECARHMNANFWYPSPEIIPGTDFRPGCIWLSSGVRFLQAISVKLTDFAFPTSEAATQAKAQFEQTPNTLCQAPGRMTFWDTSYPNDCIPFYDFTVEKNETTGFDVDYQRVVSGHKLNCKPGGLVLKQTLEPGKGPETLSPEQIRMKELEQQRKNENAQNTDAPPAGSGSCGGEVGATTPEENSEQGLNPDGPPPGAGSFGGTCGIVPESSTVEPGEFVGKVKPCPSAVPVTRRQVPSPDQDHCIDRLVISHLKDHSAREVCEMEASWGPDFVSTVEGLYCNMCTRELLELCSTDLKDGDRDCFDLDQKVTSRYSAEDLKVQGEYERTDLEAKHYNQVLEWKE